MHYTSTYFCSSLFISDECTTASLELLKTCLHGFEVDEDCFEECFRKCCAGISEESRVF